MLNDIFGAGDHPKTAEAIARKINLILGDTRETLAAKTGRMPAEVYEDEVNAVVVHGDDIDGLQGWQWDQSELSLFLACLSFRNGFSWHCGTQQSSVNRRLYSLEPHLNTSWRSVGDLSCGDRPVFIIISPSQTCSSFGSHRWGVCARRVFRIVTLIVCFPPQNW